MIEVQSSVPATEGKRASSAVKVVIIGCGAVSRLFYSPALRELERIGIAQVSGFCDPSAESRSTFARAFPTARSCSGTEAALFDGNDLVIVASPPSCHFRNVTAAFDAGLDVLCEKPIASTVEESSAMCAAAVRAGRLLAVGHYKRFMPAHRAIKILIENQTFGQLKEVEIAEGGKFLWPAVSDSFFRKEHTPGGVLLDSGVHVLDLLLWWFGEPAVFDYADDARDGLEANCLLTMGFPLPGLSHDSDVRVRIRLSRDWATPNCYVFRFQRATVHSRVNASNQLEITLDELPMTLAAELRDPLPMQPAPPTVALESNAQAFIAQLVDVCSAVRERRSPAVTGEDGTRVIRWIQRCYAVRKPLSEQWQHPPARNVVRI